MTTDPLHIWQGVYSSFAEAKGDLGVFEQNIWIEKLTDQTKGALGQTAKDTHGVIPQTAQGYDYILPVVAVLSRLRRKPLRILDFGGGMANSFFDLVAKAPALDDVEFHIVENEAICLRANALLKNEPRVSFHTALPEMDQFDIIHLGSSLHYVEDWRGLLEALAGYRPEFFLFAELPADDIPRSFVTLQHFYGRHIPVWFWKLGDILTHMESLGYDLTYRSRHLAKYGKTLGAPPMDGLPQNVRLGSFCQLLFSRKHSGVGEKNV
jgi:putative methyltransferase (TIGR04325 family)